MGYKIDNTLSETFSVNEKNQLMGKGCVFKKGHQPIYLEVIVEGAYVNSKDRGLLTGKCIRSQSKSLN